MKHSLILYYSALATLIVTIGCGCSGKRQIPPMQATYKINEKGPMGGYMAFHLLSQQFKQKPVLARKEVRGAYNPLTYMTGTTYVLITPRISLRTIESGFQKLEERDIIMEYVNRGNELFISSDQFPGKFLDTLDVEISGESAIEISKRMLKDDLGMRDTYTAMAPPETDGKKYGLFYYPFLSKIAKYDSATTTVLGTNEKGEPNYIVIRHGKGKIYLHTEPAAFSNYFLLTTENKEYYEKVFSYLQQQPNQVYIADSPVFSASSDFSALKIFWENPPLLYALLITCALMLLYIAFGSKRQRRLVPAMPANTNSTVSFVHTIAGLYLQKKDNRNMALKMTTYFLDYVRNHYYLNTSLLNQEFAQSLSRKSGISEKRVEHLIERIDVVNLSEKISDTQLFDLHNRIEEFYKR